MELKIFYLFFLLKLKFDITKIFLVNNYHYV